MTETQIASIKSFELSSELNDFFGEKNLIIHYNLDWILVNESVEATNFDIERVYSNSMRDVGKSDVKISWTKEEFPENIYNSLLEIVKSCAQCINPSSIPLPSEFMT